MYRSSVKELEYVVEGYGPGVVRIALGAAICISCKRIFCMEVSVLHNGDFCDRIPELNRIICVIVNISACFSCIGQAVQNIGLEAGTAKVYACAYVIVSYIQLPAADFLQVALAVADACVPSGIFQRTGFFSVFPVFAEYTEIADRYYEAYAPYACFVVDTLIPVVVMRT